MAQIKSNFLRSVLTERKKKMDSSEKQVKHLIPVVDFVPAELKKGKKGNWRIEYYIADPTSNSPTLKRKQNRVKPMANTRERERFAKRICYEINRKLERGWNPIIEQEAPRSLTLLKDVIDRYLNNVEKQVKDNSLREDTLRAYKSYLKNLQTFLESKGEKNILCLKFNRNLISEFLDYIYFERNNSPRTYNNYLGFVNLFSRYMIQKGHIKANPAEAFEKKRKGEKKRSIIQDNHLKQIFHILQEKDFFFSVACGCMYYELIRRTEMSKLLVSDVNLKERYILVRKEVSKNHKTCTVTILEEYLPLLIEHLKGAAMSDFLFSSNNFQPGPLRIQPKAFSDRWQKWKKQLKWRKEYHLYSLKDTGITNLLRAGVPAIHVRDHARHHDIAMTQKYTPMNTGVSSEFLDGKLKM